jgi:hypothetical protein
MTFERRDTATIMDGMVVRYRGKVHYVNAPKISASRNCVMVSGHLEIYTHDDMCDVHEVLRTAWEQHRRLRSGRDPWTEAELPHNRIEASTPATAGKE